MSLRKNIERSVEKSLFASRWLMAPVYIGLVGGLLILLYGFISELIHLFTHLPTLTQNDLILGILSLIDLSLAGNLLLIVIFSGYENFVSKIETDDHEDQPDWKGSVDFATLKLKLIASIVAISGIHLLKVFMNVEKTQESHIIWMVVIHFVFVLSGVLLALMDRITAQAKALKNAK